MSRTNTITATLAGILAALAFGGATAGAMPLQSPHEYDAGHASIAQEQAQTQAASQPKAAAPSHQASVADFRSPDTREAAINNGTAKQPVLQGAPQFSSTNVSPLQSTQPVKDDGNDVPLAGIILGLTGAGLLGVGGAFAVSKATRSRRARVVA
jgi:hypothetical protein